ncbi:amino acid adenylation domain-containing protein [Streptomyces avermitilis]|uniref:amino acid adenylation domain-containing protein n=1 Tax=Streptomyces avermitilis TaxID=33903 RepID=UPI0033FF913A
MSSSQQPAADPDDRAQLLQRWLAGRRGSADASAVPRADRSAPLRASSGQRRLWFQDHAEDVSGDRNIPFAWRLTGRLDTDALFGALDLIARRHEALRTAFREDGAELLQEVRDPYAFDRTVVEVSASALTGAVETATYEPFDWTVGRLLRARLFRLSADEHVLLLVAPHLVVDDWSTGTLLAELTAGYAALTTGDEPALPELVVQYPDFAEWQRTRLENGALQQGIDFWLRALDGATTVLDLPTDRPRPAHSSHRAGWTPLDVDAVTARAVEELCAREKATSFMALLAAYAVLLARRSGSRDLVIGSPVAGRALSELEPLIGFFVNTVPLRVRVDPQQPFTALLRQVRETVLSAMEHQEVPFDHLVQLIAPERSTAANPLVQVAFSLNAAAGRARPLPGLEVSDHPVAGRSSRYDLVLALAPEGDGLHGEVVYDADLFDAATAEHLVTEYLATVRALVAEPELPLLRLPGDPVDAALDGPAVGFDAGLNVAALVAETARQDPDRVAVRAPDGEFGFAGLDRRANALAAALREHGAGPEHAVGVHLGRTRDLVAALLAVWKTGAAFVPLDPAHPVDRLAATVRDAGVSVLVAEAAAPLTRAADGVPVLDPSALAVTEAPEVRPERSLPDALAYIVYTSGTTGEPKGVAVSYRNLANLVGAVAPLAPPRHGLGGNVLAPAFDGWLWSTVLPLAHGRGVVLADPLDGMDTVLDGSVDLITATPSLLAAQEPPTAGSGPRTVVVAGEASAPALVERWSRGRRFVNAYGPTETTICATWADSAAGDDPVTIGRPLPNYRIRVLDRYLRPVPAGTPGELFIAGEGVARGYRDLPGQTAARFLPDPLGDGGRMYRTGDVVRLRPDRTLEFVGRADQQIKVRGFRVEPAGIERAASAVAGVRSAAFFTVPGPVAPALGLAVVPEDTAGEKLETEVRTALESVLPDFMVPSYVLRVDRLPLTATGKVDEAALVLLCEKNTDRDRAGAAPSTPSGQLVARAWSTVLKKPVDSVEDNFFELGGHSLVATQVVSMLRKETGLRLPMRLLFAHPTVGALAAELDRLAAEREATPEA